MQNRISKYFSLKEATKSRKAIELGISNEPDDIQLGCLKQLGERILDPVREFAGGPVYCTSIFRSPEVNVAIKGSATSQHCKGQAADIDADFFEVSSNKEIFDYIKDNLEFDQLIWEFGDDDQPAWVHVSFDPYKSSQRGMILRAVKVPDEDNPEKLKTKYLPYE